jgi:hypothetical protein
MKAEVKAMQGLTELTEERDAALAEATDLRKRLAQAEQNIRAACDRICDLEDQLYSPTAAAIHSHTECSAGPYPQLDALALRVTPLCAQVLITRHALRDSKAPYSVVSQTIDSMVEKIADGYRKQFHELMQREARRGSFVRGR